jgi:hypothetical protein
VCVPDDARGFENLRLGEDRQKDILVKVDASVGEFSEGSLLLEFGGLFGILHKISLSVFQSRLFGIVPLLTYEASAMMASWRQCACHLSGMFEKEGIGKGLDCVLKWLSTSQAEHDSWQLIADLGLGLHHQQLSSSPDQPSANTTSELLRDQF